MDLINESHSAHESLGFRTASSQSLGFRTASPETLGFSAG